MQQFLKYRILFLFTRNAAYAQAQVDSSTYNKREYNNVIGIAA